MSIGPWIGLKQNRNSPAFREPDGGWEWVDRTNAPVSWHFTAPNNDCFGVAEDYANMTFDGQVNDLGEDPECVGAWTYGAINSYVVEWDADCNGDGIVDKGQILSGQFPDANNNGIPDGGVSINTQPTNQSVGVDQPVFFVVEASTTPNCTTPINYRWQRRNPVVLDDNAPNAWIDLQDGGGFLNTATASMTILRPTAGLATGYRCKISGGCGCEGLSNGVVYTNIVNFAPACPSDFNNDGSVDGDDVIMFFERWDGGC